MLLLTAGFPFSHKRAWLALSAMHRKIMYNVKMRKLNEITALSSVLYWILSSIPVI